jgi:hypothetical protein
MQQYTLNNYLPKSLVSLGNETILDAQLKDAHELANKVVIICRNEHSAMYEDICRLKNYQNVQLIEYSLADGTFNTIQYALKMLSEFCNLTDKQSALFVWSDIICKHKNTNTLKTLTKLNSFNANKQLQVTVGLDSNKIHRFLYNANAITEVSDAKGNIVGVYATNNAKCLLKSMSKYDFTNKDFVQYVQKASKDNELHMTATILPLASDTSVIALALYKNLCILLESRPTVTCNCLFALNEFSLVSVFRVFVFLCLQIMSDHTNKADCLSVKLQNSESIFSAY